MNGEREPNVEAGEYIEDDPEAWVAWLAMVREYGPQFAALAKHVGSEDGAASILAGTILSRLADQHGIFLLRRADGLWAKPRYRWTTDGMTLDRAGAYVLAHTDPHAEVRAALAASEPPTTSVAPHRKGCARYYRPDDQTAPCECASIEERLARALCYLHDPNPEQAGLTIETIHVDDRCRSDASFIADYLATGSPPSPGLHRERRQPAR